MRRPAHFADLGIARRPLLAGIEIRIGGVEGQALGDDGIGDGLGTQIVRTLVEGELSGTITWEQRPEGGTRVVIEIPLRFLDA